MKNVVRLFLATLTVICISGCGSVVNNAGSTTSTNDAPYGARAHYGEFSDSVTISNAYLQQIQEKVGQNAYRSGKERVNTIVSDGKITADEINELERYVVGCYAQHDLQVNKDYWFTDGGGINIWKGQERNGDFVKECEINSGYQLLIYYYYLIDRNPDNIDLEPYRYQCYQEHDLLMQPYSYEDYERLRLQSNGTPLLKGGTSGDPTTLMVAKCTDDPLHNIANSPLKQ